eukprot:CAMPEP_0181439652 /NCGR_PEP_ID=MMETSP1110-20121109/22543_1 /TAXON_ID=174948 /ORGANISM="Symbiodinium sp., Strain CCMP421" /LENGTH=370 /DNA_ID=CAMNT_0023563393 /DNA_START=51 /DNA_END=1164 /DNA_ORIENTATION=+
MISTTSGLFDLAIFAAYISIPLQLIFVATRKVTAIDFRKITGNMTTDELAVSRTLILAFALFILFCGFGHGIKAYKALTNTSEAIEALEVPVHVATALVSVGTSLLLAISLPKIMFFCNSIEIHRKGYLKVMMEERGEQFSFCERDGQELKSDQAEQLKTSERELRSKLVVMEKRFKKLHDEMQSGSVDPVRAGYAKELSVDLQQLEEGLEGIHRKTEELAQELKPLPNLLGKSQGQRQVLSVAQLLQLIAAVYVLQKARPKWGSNPDGTWGDFHILLKRILKKGQSKDLVIPLGSWMEICTWCASLSSKQLIAILQTVLEFSSAPEPEQVVKLAEQLDVVEESADGNQTQPREALWCDDVELLAWLKFS